MKKLSAAIICVIIVSVIGCAKPQDTAAILAESDELEANFIKMAQLKHWGMLADYYQKSDDIVMYPSSKLEIKGWEGINEEFMGIGSMTPGEAEIEFTLERENAAVFGNYVVTWGKGTWKVSYHGRDSTAFTWRYTNVKQKIDGTWYYIHDHGSVPMASEEMNDDMKESHGDDSGDYPDH